MKKFFNKIVVVGLQDDYAVRLAEVLAQSLGMMFCRAKDLVEYELIDKDRLKTFVDEKYLREQEEKVFKHISSFSDVVVSVDYDMFSKNRDLLTKKSATIFVRTKKEDVKDKISLIAWEKRTEELQKMADVVVDFVEDENENDKCNEIIEKLGELL